MFNLCKQARWVDKPDLSISLLNQKTDGGKVTQSLIRLGAFYGWNGLEHVMAVSPSLTGLRSPRFLTVPQGKSLMAVEGTKSFGI